MRAQKKTGD